MLSDTISDSLTVSSRPVATRGVNFTTSVPVTVRVARTTDEIEALRPIWLSWNHNPHTEIDVYLMRIRVNNGALRPHVVVVDLGGRPECMLVGVTRQERMRLNFGGTRILLREARVLRFLREGFLGNQSERNARILLQSVLGSLRRNEADVAEFAALPVDSVLYSASTKVPGILCREHSPLVVFHRSLLLPNTFEQFLNELPRKIRHNIKRQSSRLLRDFPDAEVRCVHRGMPLDEFVDATEEVAQKTYQRKLGTSFMADDETREWLRMDAEKGTLRGYVLYLCGKPAAFLIATVCGHTSYNCFMGYDPQHHQYAAGSFLLMHSLQETLTMRGPGKAAKVDFGPGDHRYKRDVSNREQRVATVSVFAPRPEWIAMNLLRSGLVCIAKAGKAWLKDGRFRDKVVRTWRQIVLAKRKLSGSATPSTQDNPLPAPTRSATLLQDR